MLHGVVMLSLLKCELYCLDRCVLAISAAHSTSKHRLPAASILIGIINEAAALYTTAHTCFTLQSNIIPRRWRASGQLSSLLQLGRSGFQPQLQQFLAAFPELLWMSQVQAGQLAKAAATCAAAADAEQVRRRQQKRHHPQRAACALVVQVLASHSCHTGAYHFLSGCLSSNIKTRRL